MFKDYQFFSNNLQDAARQILEAQEAQAKKENVEAVKPGPNEPMGQPLDGPAYDPDIQRGQFNTIDLHPIYDEENEGIVQPLEPAAKRLKRIGLFTPPPSYEDDPTFVGPPAPFVKQRNLSRENDNVPNEKDDELTRMMKVKKAAYDEAQAIKNWEFREEMIEKQRLARERDQLEAWRQGTSIENYYKMKDRENERAAEREEKRQQEQERRRQQGGVPMSELA
jgi:hypothetical protein